MKHLMTVALITFGSSFAIAQTTAPTPPPSGVPPTAAQCKAGYKEGTSWTREEFVKACAEDKGLGK
jgi:hypothetical protein